MILGRDRQNKFLDLTIPFFILQQVLSSHLVTTVENLVLGKLEINMRV